ncbi:salicylate hydroxylase [Mycolicibacterium sp. 018/SC-01/001]|nr:salicylate hydroxylase [Mycolicibacterium sp. 018/SC-01/001]
MVDEDALRVAIVGAGIGGLTAALALRAHGIDARVFEQASELRALGAGVSIAPNGARVFAGLGVGERLREVAGRYSHYVFRTANGQPVGGEPSRLSFGDPARTMFLHRGEFQAVLSGALPDSAIRLGRKVVEAHDGDDGVTVRFADGSAVTADLLIAADGIHSRLQGLVDEPAQPVSEGIMAYRGLIPAERLAGIAPVAAMDACAMWMGPGRSFLVYPVSAGRLLNVVAFVPTDLDVTESWTAPGDVRELASAYSGWDRPVLDIIDCLDETFRWGIYDREPVSNWSGRHVTLLGDCAHAVVPHLGQGANQAVEDAITLATLLQRCPREDLPSRLRLYQDLRLARTRQVRDGAREAGRIYRSTDLDPHEQAGRIEAIFDRIGVNSYDAQSVARTALTAA